MQNNEELKQIMKENKIPQWKLADRLLVCENTVARALRKPLTEEKYNLYYSVITEMIGA